MIATSWGRVVNVSTGLAGRPHELVGGNAYTTSKAGLEAHTINLAAELEATGVTINVYRPGMVDTAMQEWLRTRDPKDVGQPLHDRFSNAYQEGKLRGADLAARALVVRIEGKQTGQIWNITDKL
jgi:NAD(P)-dependent dehydrogenase (short-subunit alcohol dehydrogenase family)